VLSLLGFTAYAAPMSANSGFIMFAQWGGLDSQAETACSAEPCPAAMFSPTRRHR
jgi:hypothetical protein